MDAGDHVRRFNAAVTSGDWRAFVGQFSDDAVMEFVGPPIGPFSGRDAIEGAYAANPPDDTIEVDGAATTHGDQLDIPFRWTSTGERGVLRLTERSGQIARMVIAFT
jgi:hypothetical protein